jgi:hypothetical protein
MRNLTTTLCLTIAVILGSAGMSASADFQKGLTAARSGDFATALREWTPLAKQGNASAQFNNASSQFLSLRLRYLVDLSLFPLLRKRSAFLF